MAALPTHFWTLILFLRDFSWLTERTNAWDALGVGAYGLLIALAESILVFGVALLLSLLIPTGWEENKRIALLFVQIVLVALWTIFDQLYFMLGLSLPASIVQFIANASHPLRILYILYLALVISSIVIPTWLVIQSKKTQVLLNNVIERLSLLSALYLSLDIISFVVVVIRNL